MNAFVLKYGANYVDRLSEYETYDCRILGVYSTEDSARMDMLKEFDILREKVKSFYPKVDFTETMKDTKCFIDVDDTKYQQKEIFEVYIEEYELDKIKESLINLA